MPVYRIRTTPDFEADYIAWLKSGQRKVVAKIDALMDEIEQQPRAGIGKPEQLRNIRPECWSRRITQKDRLVYHVQGDTVTFIQCRGHYSDK